MCEGLDLPKDGFKLGCTEFLSQEAFDIIPVHEGGGTCLLENRSSIYKRHCGGCGGGSKVLLSMDQVSNQVSCKEKVVLSKEHA